MEELQKILHRLDGRGYKSYQEIRGSYEFSFFTLFLDHIQKDPFASPTRLRARVSQRAAKIPSSFYHNKVRRIGAEDFLARRMGNYLQKIGSRHGKESGNISGSGKSGLLQVQGCGQEILERTAVVINDEYVEIRLSAGLPARGRTVLGRSAAEMLCRRLPEALEHTILASNIDLDAFKKHVDANEDQEILRGLLGEKGLVAFIADGSLLPRGSGISDKPLRGEKAVVFRSPSRLAVELELPHRGRIRGMGIRPGITLIVGGGYHGKSTLLRALERGVYNHIPGDGREYVVTVKDAVKIRAEDGRRVCKVDISPFINNLPGGTSTTSFSTEEASGSTSQAANIMEALEYGTSLLLLDEDTSASNFMIRDRRMQRLVARDKEPIIPFLDKVKALFRDYSISTIMVMGGSGDYFDVSDTVIMMDEYKPLDVTEEAAVITGELPREREFEGGKHFGTVTSRKLMKRGLEPLKGKKKKIASRGLHTVQYGVQNLSLFYVEQLVDPGQTRAIGDLMFYIAERYVNGRTNLQESIKMAFRDIEEKGLEIISPFYGEHPGDYSLPRPQEVAASFNRLRSLNVT